MDIEINKSIAIIQQRINIKIEDISLIRSMRSMVMLIHHLMQNTHNTQTRQCLISLKLRS